jgi:predicted metal-dependent HD superfamily phosphohydrolase
VSGDQLELHVAWQRHVGRGNRAEALFESVVARHREPGRHYHDLRHVTWVVRHVVDLADRFPVDDLDAVVAAAFFHDAVYQFDLGGDADGNEVASARLAARSLRDLGWADERADRVATMIVATEHRAEQEVIDVDTAVLLAADLAALAAAPTAYTDAARNIRKEYGHLGDDDWRAGRSEVLRGFLARDHIYPSRLQLDAWERRARANLAAELAALG